MFLFSTKFHDHRITLRAEKLFAALSPFKESLFLTCVKIVRGKKNYFNKRCSTVFIKSVWGKTAIPCTLLDLLIIILGRHQDSLENRDWAEGKEDGGDMITEYFLNFQKLRISIKVKC